MMLEMDTLPVTSKEAAVQLSAGVEGSLAASQG